MSNEPTNGELAIMLTNMLKSIDDIKEHLRVQNGKVTRNTEFRNKVIGGMVVVSAIGAANLVALLITWARL